VLAEFKEKSSETVTNHLDQETDAIEETTRKISLEQVYR
jgi:hypothetical protein